MKHTILAAVAVIALVGGPVAFAGKPASELAEIKCPECGKPLAVSMETNKKTNSVSITLKKVGGAANPKN